LGGRLSIHKLITGSKLNNRPNTRFTFSCKLWVEIGKNPTNLFLQSMTQLSTFSCKLWIEIEKTRQSVSSINDLNLLLSLVNCELKLKKPDNLFLQSMTQISTFSCKLWIEIEIEKTQLSSSCCVLKLKKPNNPNPSCCVLTE
jgi:hypothetical protein